VHRLGLEYLELHRASPSSGRVVLREPDESLAKPSAVHRRIDAQHTEPTCPAIQCPSAHRAHDFTRQERDGRLTARYRRTDVVDVGPLDLGREESNLRVRIRSVHDVDDSGGKRKVLGDIRLQPSDGDHAQKLQEHSRQRTWRS